MSNPDTATDYNQQLTNLAVQFDDVAAQAEAIEAQLSGDEQRLETIAGGWIVLRNRIRQLNERYRKLVKTAGELMISIQRKELISVDGLPVLLAAHDLGGSEGLWDGLVADPANLFALLVGGERIELRFGDNIGEYRKYNQGLPIQYRPLKPRNSVPQGPPKLGGVYSPDADQCRRYGEFCRSLVAPNLAGKPAGGKQPAKPAKKGKPVPKASVNARMLEMMQKNLQETKGWNSTKWAQALGCVRSSVVETQTWKMLAMERDRIKAERALDRRRRPKASDQRRD